MNEESKRFEVTLAKPGEPAQHTFTWAATAEEARKRMAQQMADQWDGWTFTVAGEGVDLPQDTEALWALLADVMEALQQAGEDPRFEADGQWETYAIRRAPEHGSWARKVEWTNSSGAWRWTYKPHAD